MVSDRLMQPVGGCEIGMLLSDGMWLSLGGNRSRRSEAGLYDSALSMSSLVCEDGSRVIALSKLRISICISSMKSQSIIHGFSS